MHSAEPLIRFVLAECRLPGKMPAALAMAMAPAIDALITISSFSRTLKCRAHHVAYASLSRKWRAALKGGPGQAASALAERVELSTITGDLKA